MTNGFLFWSVSISTWLADEHCDCAVYARVRADITPDKPGPTATLSVLNELVIEDSNSEEAAWHCWRAAGRCASGQRIKVRVTGDSSGNQHRTSASRTAPTDWAIVRQVFQKYTHKFNVTFDIRSTNPGVKDRVNMVNALVTS